MIDSASRALFNDDHHAFRDTVRRYLAAEIAPNLDRHEADGIVERAAWEKAGAAGLLCPQVPEAYGGLGLDFGFNAIVAEEIAYLGTAVGFTLQSDIVADYLVHYASEEQKQRSPPRHGRGDHDQRHRHDRARRRAATCRASRPSPAATAMAGGCRGRRPTSPTARAPTSSSSPRARPRKAASRGLSLFLVEAGDEGFTRGRNLDKIGLHGNDTSELFFDEVKLPADRLLGAENGGFAMLMSQLPQERLSIAVQCQASAQRAFDEAVKFTADRKAFGKRILDFQNSRFALADLKTRLQVGWAHLDWAIGRHIAGQLTPVEASAAKLWHSEMQWDACDLALQLHGGAGYMNEYPIARLWRDARVARIYGGTSEIMKELIGRSLG